MAFSLGLTGLGSSLQKTLAGTLTKEELQKRTSVFSAVSEAFGVPDVSESKTVDVAQVKFDAMFEKAAATQTYGFADSLKFRVVIPFKNLFGKASEAEQEDLELYNMHQELRSSVEAVQKAYKNYLPAEQAVTEATPEALRAARFQEKNKGIALVQSYKDLIALAVKQAQDLSNKAGTTLNASRSAYLQDTQTALDEDIEAQGAIFYTVHMLSTREAARGSVEGSEHTTNFIELVNNYNQLERKALSELGKVPTDHDVKLFKEAFIEGLAAVPGLKASDVATYESIFTLAKDQYNNEMVGHFVAEMNNIIQGNKPAEEVLRGIQYKGVYLPITDELIKCLDQARTRLQQLKELEAQRDALLQQAQEAKETIKSLKTPTKHTVQEFADFVGNTQDKDGLRRKIEAGEGRFAAVKALETLQKQITALEEQSAKAIAQFEEQIREKARGLDELQRGFDAKAAEEKTCEGQIRTLTATLQTLRQNIAQVNDKISGLSVSTTEQEILDQVKIAGRGALAAREKHYTDTIDELQKELRTRQQDLEQRGLAISRLKDEIKFDEACAAEFKNTGSPDVKDELQRLRTARETLSQTSSEISGDELLEIANSLGLASKKNGNLGTAFENAQKVRALEETQEIRVKEFEQVEDSISAARENLPQGIAYVGETLKVVAEQIFTAKQLTQMDKALEERLKVAIEISQAVHNQVHGKRETLLDQADDKKYLGLTGLEQEVLLTKRQEERVLVRRDSFSSEASSQLSTFEDDSASEFGEQSSTAVSQPGWLSRNYGPARPSAPDYFPAAASQRSSFSRIFGRAREEPSTVDKRNAAGMPIAPAAQPRPVAQQLPEEASEVINIDEA